MSKQSFVNNNNLSAFRHSSPNTPFSLRIYSFISYLATYISRSLSRASENDIYIPTNEERKKKEKVKKARQYVYCSTLSIQKFKRNLILKGKLCNPTMKKVRTLKD